MARDVIIDCDTGMDDAIALLLAIRSPELNVKGITCVNGNVNLDNVVKNTLRVVEHSGMDIPVYAGARTALIPNKVRDDASRVHRKNSALFFFQDLLQQRKRSTLLTILLRQSWAQKNQLIG